MNRRPFVVFSILYVCGIIISDKIYNKEYIDIFEFLIIGTFMACLWNYKFVSNDSCIDKDKRNYSKKRKYAYISIGVCCILVGVICTLYAEKRNSKEIEFKEKCVDIMGEVYTVSEKENSYAVTLAGVKDSSKQYGKVLVYLNKEEFKDLFDNIQNGDDRIEKNAYGVKVGCLIRISGEPSNFLTPTNQGQFDERTYYVKQLGYKYKVYGKKVDIVRSSLKYYRADKKIYYWLKRVLYNIKNTLKTQLYKIYNENIAGLISGIILGEKSLIDEKTMNLYQSAGISHILAISGLHITILGMCIYKVLSKMKINVYIKNSIVIPIIMCYGIMTDFSISTNRAVVMMIIMLMSRFFGRTYDIYTSLALSLVIILMQNPLLIYHSGLLFSYGAIIGIIYVYPALSSCICREIVKIVNRFGIIIDEGTGECIDDNKILDIKDIIRKVIRYYSDSIIMGISIYLIILPIMINTYHEINILSIFINVIVLALSGILIILCFITPIINIIFNKIAYLTGGAPYVILKIYEVLGKSINNTDVNRIIIAHKPLWQIIIYYCVIIVFIWMVTRKIKDGYNTNVYNVILNQNVLNKNDGVKCAYNMKGSDNMRCIDNIIYKNDKSDIKYSLNYIFILILCSIIFIDFSAFSFKAKKLNINMLDVSQGDGLCIQTPSDKVITVDGGSSDVKDIDKYRLVPFLKYKGIDTIDYAFISHLDTDHISGIQGIISNNTYGIKVRNVVLPYVSEKNETYSEFEKMVNNKGVNVLYFTFNNRIKIDNVTFTCLHPNNEYIPVSETENSYSEVILMSYKQFDMLFTGDVEADGEKIVSNKLKNSIIDKKIDVIKVPHHGSKNSSTEEFIATVNPRFALISAGKNNRYGHPHKETLERYKKINSIIYSTKEIGAISLVTDGEKIDIASRLKK